MGFRHSNLLLQQAILFLYSLPGDSVFCVVIRRIFIRRKFETKHATDKLKCKQNRAIVRTVVYTRSSKYTYGVEFIASGKEKENCTVLTTDKRE